MEVIIGLLLLIVVIYFVYELAKALCIWLGVLIGSCLNWLVFRLLFILLFCLQLVGNMFWADIPQPSPVEANGISISKLVSICEKGVTQEKGTQEADIAAAIFEAASRGDVGSQYVLAELFKSIAERGDLLIGAVSTLTGVPEYGVLLAFGGDNKLEAGKTAESLFKKVEEQGYNRARPERYSIVLTRWERNIELLIEGLKYWDGHKID